MARTRLVTTQSLILDPSLVGRALAPPWRRALALLVDLLLLLVPTVAVAVGAAALSLRLTEPVAWKAIDALLLGDPPGEQVPRLAADLAPLLVAIDAPGLPTDLRYAVEHGDRRRVEALMTELDYVVVLSLAGSPPPATEGKVLVPIERLIPAGARTLALLGVPALYFTLGHARRGATLGKRLLGIAVRRLDGRRLGLLASLERFGGYFSIPGTLGIGLVELWRDPLRQLGHDRGAGTVVVVHREPRPAQRPAPPLTRPRPPAEGFRGHHTKLTR